MPPPLTRRALIGAGSALAIAPAAIYSPARAASSNVRTGPVYVLVDSIRVFDSRTAHPGLGGGRLTSGNSIGVSVGGVVEGGGDPAAVYVNVTVTETRGWGYLIVRASDLVGDRPLPNTSNINWSTNGQTLANLTFTAVGGENMIEVHAAGGGSTHFIIDVQGYIPFT